MTRLTATATLLLACCVSISSNAPATTTPATAHTAEPTAAPTASATADGMTGSTVAGGHKIELIGSGNVKNMDSVLVLRRDPAFPMFGDSNVQQFADTATFNFPGNLGPGGFGQAGGGGGGAGIGFAAAGGGAGGAVGGQGGEHISPNFGLALKITPEKPPAKRKAKVIVDIQPGATLVEQDGQTVQTPAGSLQVSCPEFEQQFPEALFLYAERTQNPNRVLAEIRGTLKIQPGRELKAVFQGAKPGKLRVDGEEFHLQKVEQTAAGLNITVAFPPTTLAKNARTIPERMQAMLQACLAIHASIEDSAGQFHEAKSGGSAGGSSSGASSFTFNGAPQGQKNFLPPLQPNVMSFQFSPLTDDRTVKNIILRLADIEGKPELVPFTIAVQPVPQNP